MSQKDEKHAPFEPGKNYTTVEKSEKCDSRDHKRTTVRFSDGEYERITEEAKLSGESIPALLKRSHFRHQKLRLLFGEEERRWACSELRRIGNNVNQIARRVNSGVLEGWYPEFSEMLRRITDLCNIVVGSYGAR